MNGSAGIEGVGQVSLFVTDLDQAGHFYGEALGLSHLYTFGDLAFYDCGGIRLYLHRVPTESWRPGSLLYLRVSDIDAAYRELAARGVAFVGPPELVHRHASGVEEWMAFFRDPDGNELALMAQRG